MLFVVGTLGTDFQSKVNQLPAYPPTSAVTAMIVGPEINNNLMANGHELNLSQGNF